MPKMTAIAVASATKTVVASKKKRVSKRNKESWRKHIDITDVDKFLDEQRQDERIG